MRNIKFRGKRIDNGEWVYGLFARHKIGNLICPCIQIEKESDFGDHVDYIEIKGETLSQYTGIKDKNNKEIYEGDILFIKDKDCQCTDSFTDTVSYETYGYYPFIKTIGRQNTPLIEIYDVEVIGNVFKNKYYCYDESKDVNIDILNDFNFGEPTWKCSSEDKNDL